MCIETKPTPEAGNLLITCCPVCGEEHVVSLFAKEYVCGGSAVEYDSSGTRTKFIKGAPGFHPKWYEAVDNYLIKYKPTTRPLTNNFLPDPTIPTEPPPAPQMGHWEGRTAPTHNISKVGALLSPEAPTVVNARGGKQSETGVRMDLIPPKALFRVASILKYGAEKYGEDNWHKIETKSHLNHALVHLYAFLSGDTQDDHLGHACCRLQMALERHLMDEEEGSADVPF